MPPVRNKSATVPTPFRRSGGGGPRRRTGGSACSRIVWSREILCFLSLSDTSAFLAVVAAEENNLVLLILSESGDLCGACPGEEKVGCALCPPICRSEVLFMVCGAGALEEVVAASFFCMSELLPSLAGGCVGDKEFVCVVSCRSRWPVRIWFVHRPCAPAFSLGQVCGMVRAAMGGGALRRAMAAQELAFGLLVGVSVGALRRRRSSAADLRSAVVEVIPVWCFSSLPATSSVLGCWSARALVSMTSRPSRKPSRKRFAGGGAPSTHSRRRRWWTPRGLASNFYIFRGVLYAGVALI